MAKPKTHKPHSPAPKADNAIAAVVSNAVSLRPSNFKMPDLIWRYVIRSILRGDTIMLVGPTGCGKTQTAYTAASVMDRQLFVFNMGATQDARGALMGNTHYDPARGTYVAESEFIRAIQTENAVILLDEMSRAHPDASNILMTVLDKKQRYLRLDEKPGSPIIRVHPSVSFFLTANVGSEYTGTRTMDRALYDRSKIVEVAALGADDEYALLIERFPDVDANLLRQVASIAGDSRLAIKAEDTKLDTIISTRATLEIAELLFDGFTLDEAAEICIYPLFSDDGGIESSRAAIKKIVQKYAGQTAGPDADDSELPWK